MDTQTNTEKSEVEFGKVSTVKVLDEHGSRVTTEQTIVKYLTVAPVRRKYEFRHRVRSQKEELEEYMKFSDDLMAHEEKLDPMFKIDRSRIGKENGYYYTVTCYTLLEAQ